MKGYSAVRTSHRLRRKLKPGEIRFVSARKPVICSHLHRTKGAAHKCAEKMQNKHGGKWSISMMEG